MGADLIVIPHSLTVSNSPVLQIKYCKVSGHGWVRTYLTGRLAWAEFPRGVEFQGSLAPFFSPHP